jgi:plasmid stabilization system protein ParE
MKKPKYTTAAREDLVDIVRYISQDKPNAAVAWVEKIEEKCLLIASQPEMGERRPQLGTEVRCRPLRHFLSQT